jgi:cell division control protein 6
MEPLTDLLNKQDLKKMAAEIEKSSSVFANKAALDNLIQPTKIVGRENKIRELMEFLLSYKKRHVVPFISVYGRSGSGKSTIVRFVCETLSETDNAHSDISYEFVNLRKARTIFGCTNLILSELGMPQLKSAQGMNLAIAQISKEIENRIKTKHSKLFVLVLDEFDVIFNDERVSPSDFIYKLVDMVQELKQKGQLMTAIAISNNLMSNRGFDDRITSRTGSAEIYFEPYTGEEILVLLKDRASEAFSESLGPYVLETIADSSQEEHGDARRAIDLMRLAGEAARLKGDSKVLTTHLNEAMREQKKDRVVTILSSAPTQQKVVCAALAKLTYLAKNNESSWHTTSEIFKEYEIVFSDLKDAEDNAGFEDEWANLTVTLSYRRVSDRLIELKNSGLVDGETQFQGRAGNTSKYRLTERPDMIGMTISEKWWSKVEASKPEEEPNKFWEKRFGKPKKD